MPRTRVRLGSISAVWHAFWGTDLSYFPRFIESDGEEQRVDADDLIRRVSAELGSLERPPDDKIEALIRRGREGPMDRVIEARKEPRLFGRVLMLTKNQPLAFMIGDQLDRDIAPAKAAGLTTIFLPGGFRPKWHPVEADVTPDYKVSDFNTAASIVLEAIARNQQVARRKARPERI